LTHAPSSHALELGLHDALPILGTVGEPINEEAWHWYNEKIGKGKAPIVDTWWQTENGGILMTPIAGVTETKPGYAMLPLPGVQRSEEHTSELQSREKLVCRLLL